VTLHDLTDPELNPARRRFKMPIVRVTLDCPAPCECPPPAPRVLAGVGIRTSQWWRI